MTIGTMSRTVAVALIATAMTGCAVQKELVPTGGSRSDGTVELSFEYGLFEQPKVDGAQGAQAAAQRCRAWGYSDAEAFGGSKQHCVAHDMYGSCVRMQVTVPYQCIGRPEATSAPPQTRVR